MIILPLGCYFYIVNIIITGSVDLNKGLTSLMIASLILVNPVLIITSIIELNVGCVNEYSSGHAGYMYIISITVVFTSILNHY